jgi:hypothetical protein
METFNIAGIEFTDAQVSTMVELWENLISVDRVVGSTRGYYGTDIHLASEVKTDYPNGNAYRMPNAREIRALVLSDGETTKYPTESEDDSNPWDHTDDMDPVTLTLISCGDYHGSFDDAANNRALDGMPGVNVSYPNTGGMGSVESESTVELGSVSALVHGEDNPTADDVINNLRAIVDTMVGLETDDPQLSREKYDAYVLEQAGQWWDNGLGRDVTSQLEIMNPAGSFEELPELPEGRDVDDAIREAYFGYDGTDWQPTGPNTATGVYNTAHEDAVKHVARELFGWE